MGGMAQKAVPTSKPVADWLKRTPLGTKIWRMARKAVLKGKSIMQQDRLTIKSQEALQGAQRIAQGFSHQEVDGEHLLLAMIGQADSLIPDLLEKIGVPASKLKPDLEQELGRRHKVQGTASADLFLSASLKKVLDAAQAESEKLKDQYISTEHLLLGLLDQAGSSLKKIFQTHGLKQPAGHGPKSRRQIPGPRKVRPRSHRPRAPGQGGPGHWTRRRNPPGDAGSVAAHKE
jgi:Clp amino terminal domain, pathogenicity island component